MRDQKHSFALYYADLNANCPGGNQLKISEPELVYRVIKILRLQIGDELTLFSGKQSVTGVIGSFDKKNFSLEKICWHQATCLVPAIEVVLAVLKKENFENALYSCVELGANQIKPVMFMKSTSQKLNSERLEKILISAAEQSKNFNFPVLQQPITFDDFLAQIVLNPQNTYIYCDVSGGNMLEVVNQIKTKGCDRLAIIIGPEGDLTTSEKNLLMAQPNVVTMRLTPTVLRSFQALTVALGGLRALL